MFDFLHFSNTANMDYDLKIFIKILAVSTFLDKNIKNIEMIRTQLLIKEYIKKKKPTFSETKIDEIAKNAYKKYLETIKGYKNGNKLFKSDKNTIKKYLTINPDKDFLSAIELVINADHIIEEGEKVFLGNIKKIYFSSEKKAFTLIEIVFVILSIGLLSYYTLSGMRQNDFYTGVNSLNDDIINILDNAVMNPITGYINGTGGDCSTDNSYTNLTSKRVIDCIGWSSTYPHSGTGTNSYIYKLLKTYTISGNGCKMYLKEKSSDEYYAFIDCSNINFDPATRSKKYTEDKVEYNINTHFSTIVENTYRNATSINNTSGGNDSDGKISFLMKK